jgi:hypothetical protein
MELTTRDFALPLILDVRFTLKFYFVSSFMPRQISVSLKTSCFRRHDA